MKKFKKINKILSIFLSVLIVLSSIAFSFTAFAFESVLINENNFTDPVFRSIISQYFDLDENGYLDESDVISVKRIVLFTFMEENQSVHSLKGVEYFPNLEVLQVGACGLRELDVSKNLKLKKLTCQANELTTLDLSKNTQLTELICSGNLLTSLDVSKCIELTKLHCYSNKIASIDVSANTKLIELNIHTNELSALNLSNNKSLEILQCSKNHLQRLDLEGLNLSGLSQSNIGDQTIKLTAVKSGDGFFIPIQLNTDKVYNFENGNLTNTGIVFTDYECFNKSFNYTYDTGLADSEFMNVSVNVNKAFYKVQFLGFNNEVLKEEIVYETVGAKAPIPPEVVGYHFISWDTNEYTNVTKDLTVKAVYNINEYTVTFVDYDDSVISTQKVNHGESAVAPSNPTRNGYTFAGWNANFSDVTGELTVKAQYTINKFNITFNDYNGTLIYSQVVDIDHPLVVPANPVRVGYDFTGWDKDFSTITSDMVITAIYKIHTYTVIFVDYDDKVISIQYIEYGKAAVAPASPVHDGRTFTGWEHPFNFISSDMRIHALYNLDVCRVRFFDLDYNLISTQNIKYGESAIEPTINEDALPEGYYFDGWNTDFSSVKTNLDVYAVAGLYEYSITYNNVYDATFVGTKIDKFTVEDQFILPTLSRNGFDFLGWYRNSDFSGEPVTDFDYYTVGDVVLYAKWSNPVSSSYKISGYVGVAKSATDHTATSSFNNCTVNVMSGENVIATATTDTNGYFEITGLESGSYMLVFTNAYIVERTIPVTITNGNVQLSTEDRMIGVVLYDFNGDGYINASDYTAFMTMMGYSQDKNENFVYEVDYNKDGYINAADYVNFMSFMGFTSLSYTEWVI